MEYNDEGLASKFNAGVAMAERIDSLQRAINAARFNPLMPNPETGTFNYEIMISSNDGLFKEAWSKLTADERKIGDRIKKAVYKAIEMNPPIVKNSEGLKINYQNYKKLLEMLDLYEKLNRQFLENHDLNAPNVDKGLRGL